MEYNNYYPAQAGLPPPPPPSIANQQHGCSPIQMMPGNNMMHNSHAQAPVVSMRQVITPGPGPQQMQPQQQPPPPPPPSMQQQQSQHIVPHHMGPQQHANYHQLPPHPASLPLSGSPLHHQQQQPSLPPPPRPSTGPSPQQHPLMHQQSPLHMGGPPIHIQQQSQQAPQPHNPVGQLNQIGGPMPGLMPPSLNQQQPPPPPPVVVGPPLQPHQQQHPHHNFISSGPPIPHPNQVYTQPNQIHSPLPPPPHLPPMYHAQQAPPPPHTYMNHHLHHQSLERGSPFYQNIPQAEFRIIELNKRLQSRPRPRGPPSPLPLMGSSEESFWWEKFASDFFDDDSTLTLRISADDKPVEYTIGRTLIPRFFRSYFEGGVIDLSIKLRNTRETLHSHMITLECDQTDITTKNIFKYPPASNMAMNVVVHTEGHLSLEFVNSSFDTLLIKSWRFYTTQCHEYIDRSMTTTGLPNALFVEPVTRHGLTKSTISYLKMCMIMEPMQELMYQHKQTKMDPRSCLKHLLYDKYKVKSVDDNRVQPSRRRKRKTPASTGTTKKSKANAANNVNVLNNNNLGFTNINNSHMSPSAVGGVSNLTLASQDVMVVGEPSMLGADFGDENERRITRLENNQFDASIIANNNGIAQDQALMCNNSSPHQNSVQPINTSHPQQQQHNQLQPQQTPPSQQPQPHQHLQQQQKSQSLELTSRSETEVSAQLELSPQLNDVNSLPKQDALPQQQEELVQQKDNSQEQHSSENLAHSKMSQRPSSLPNIINSQELRMFLVQDQVSE